MKLRISGNSLRLRLSQTEINVFVHKGEVFSTFQFGEKCLTYKIIHGRYHDITVGFYDDTITVFVPSSYAKNWDTDNRIGFDVTDKNGVYILIEKDFQCLKPRPLEDEADLFPNPLSNERLHE